MSMLNIFFFMVLPYVAVIIFVIAGIYRYNHLELKYSALSSQFLGNVGIFYGILPLHVGLIVVSLGHFIAFLFPSLLLAWNGQPMRLLLFEGVSIVFGFSIIFGLFVLLIRRMANSRIQAVSNKMDIIIEVSLFLQALLGIWIAIGYRWGASWFASDISPYLWSIVKFNPDISAIIALPMAIQLHVILGFIIMLLFPFTRLIHLLILPLHYINRPHRQVTLSNENKIIHKNTAPWTTTLHKK